MDMLWFWLVLTVLVVGAIAYWWGHWTGFAAGEDSIVTRMREIGKGVDDERN